MTPGNSTGHAYTVGELVARPEFALGLTDKRDGLCREFARLMQEKVLI